MDSKKTADICMRILLFSVDLLQVNCHFTFFLHLDWSLQHCIAPNFKKDKFHHHSIGLVIIFCTFGILHDLSVAFVQLWIGGKI